MKKLLTCLLLVAVWIQGQGQTQEQEPKSKKVHIGIAYTFAQNDLKVLYLKELFTWNETSSDPRELTSEELDQLNSRDRFSRQFQGLTLEAGMVLLGKPTSKWFINGAIMVGLASSRYEMQNTQVDSLEMKFTSGFNAPVFGLQCHITYRFSPSWGLTVIPHFAYAYGVDKEIEDNIYGHVMNFSETRKCTYNYLYGRLSLFASWNINTVTLSAGPGFYLLYNTNEYLINRTNPGNGDTYSTKVNSRLISRSFIDGDLMIEWNIIPSLSLSAFVAVGSDVAAKGSIRYHF